MRRSEVRARLVLRRDAILFNLNDSDDFGLITIIGVMREVPFYFNFPIVIGVMRDLIAVFIVTGMVGERRSGDHGHTQDTKCREDAADVGRNTHHHTPGRRTPNEAPIKGGEHVHLSARIFQQKLTSADLTPVKAVLSRGDALTEHHLHRVADIIKHALDGHRFIGTKTPQDVVGDVAMLRATNP